MPDGSGRRTRWASRRCIEDEIATIVGVHHPLEAAGRTDTGVHAAAQVASITIDHPIACDELLKALNARLKAGDIRIRAIEETFDRFDARIFAKTKTIAMRSGTAWRPARSFATWCGTCRTCWISDGWSRQRSRWLENRILPRSRGAVPTSRPPCAASCRRRLREINLDTDQPVAVSPLGDALRGDGRLLRLEISGTGFLRHMVRTIAGTLVDIGRGHFEPGRHAADHRLARSREGGADRPAPGIDVVEGGLLGRHSPAALKVPPSWHATRDRGR